MYNTENIAKLFPAIGALVFGGTFVFFLVISLILNYHWKKYGAGLKRIGRAKTIYFGVSGILIITMLVILFNLSS